MTEVRSSAVAFRFFGLKYYNEASNLSPFSRGELGRQVQVVRSRCQEKKSTRQILELKKTRHMEDENVFRSIWEKGRMVRWSWTKKYYVLFPSRCVARSRKEKGRRTTRRSGVQCGAMQCNVMGNKSNCAT
jgi:hypothetical protein